VYVHLPQFPCRVNWIFVLKFLHTMRASIRVSAIELTRDVTIAARARSSRGRAVAQLACLLLRAHSVSQCWSINSSQASLLPRSVPVGPARAHVALRLRYPFIGLAHSLTGRSAVRLYYTRLRRYFTSRFLLCLSFFCSEFKCLHCWCRIASSRSWRHAADDVTGWPIGPFYFCFV